MVNLSSAGPGLCVWGGGGGGGHFGGGVLEARKRVQLSDVAILVRVEVFLHVSHGEIAGVFAEVPGGAWQHGRMSTIHIFSKLRGCMRGPEILGVFEKNVATHLDA